MLCGILKAFGTKLIYRIVNGILSKDEIRIYNKILYYVLFNISDKI